MVKDWHAMYQNLCGSRRLLEGNIMNNTPIIEEVARVVRAGARILEVGAGTGVLLWPLANAGMEVVSIDNDPEVLRMAEINAQTLGANIKFQEADAFALPFEDASFAVAESHGLIEHWPDEDIDKILAEQMRVALMVVCGFPLKGCAGAVFGNERWQTMDQWMAYFKKYRVANAFTYREGQMAVVTILGNANEGESG